MKTFKIRKPDDSREYYETQLGGDVVSNFQGIWMVQNWVTASHDPIMASIKQWFSEQFKKRRYSKWSRQHNEGFGPNYSGTLYIKECPIFIEKRNSRHFVNGTFVTVDTLSGIIAKVVYRSCFENDSKKLLKFFYATLNMPEEVSYVLENRLPYFFYEDYTRHDVRLAVQRIGAETIAIEISDGVWGEMSFKEAKSYCAFYMDKRKSSKSKWAYTSPKNLYTKLVGEAPKNSELKLMIAFLQQNRKSDLVEKRAYELISDMVKQYPDRLFAKWNDDNELVQLLVSGNLYDWKLESRGHRAGSTQSVSAFIWQTGSGDAPAWRGPICIDNMTNTSSVGDQFASRAMAFLNDNMTMQMVSTLKSYVNDENINRLDDNEMRRMSSE